jgi:hypothetical protein
MKTRQIPDDFRDWIEARTFEIGAEIQLPSSPAAGLFEADVIPKRAEVPRLAKVALEADPQKTGR